MSILQHFSKHCHQQEPRLPLYLEQPLPTCHHSRYGLVSDYTGFANFHKEISERIRHLFMDHDGRKTLEVRRDDFVKGSPHDPWPDAFTDRELERCRRLNSLHSQPHPPSHLVTTRPVEWACSGSDSYRAHHKAVLSVSV